MPPLVKLATIFHSFNLMTDIHCTGKECSGRKSYFIIDLFMSKLFYIDLTDGVPLAQWSNACLVRFLTGRQRLYYVEGVVLVGKRDELVLGVDWSLGRQSNTKKIYLLGVVVDVDCPMFLQTRKGILEDLSDDVQPIYEVSLDTLECIELMLSRTFKGFTVGVFVFVVCIGWVTFPILLHDHFVISVNSALVVNRHSSRDFESTFVNTTIVCINYKIPRTVYLLST